MNLPRGAVVLVELNPTVGHEQRGVRPCIVVSDPQIANHQRFPLICVVPVTGTPAEGILGPQLAPGKSGLVKTSFALVDHLRSIDKRRIRSAFGELPREELAAIDRALIAFKPYLPPPAIHPDVCEHHSVAINLHPVDSLLPGCRISTSSWRNANATRTALS